MKTIILSYYPLYVKWNHGIHLLASVCRERGIKVFIIPLENLQKYEAQVELINPDYVGFSFVFEQDYMMSIPFVQSVKILNIPIIAGGVYVKRGTFIDVRLFNFICRGEGEILPDFILNNDTTIFDRPYIHQDINTLPLPDYNINPIGLSDRLPVLKGMKIIPYSSSRGCPHQCSFCEIRNQSIVLRMKTSIKKDLEYLYEHHLPDLFYFVDEHPPYYNEKWRTQLEGNFYKFGCYIRADITEEQLVFLIKNGLYVCGFGIESGDEKYRNEVLHKNISDEDIYRTVDILKKYGIHYAPFYMFNTPNETAEIRNKTMRMYHELGGYPQLYPYSDLRKRNCNVSKILIEQYAKKLKVTVDAVYDSLMNPDIHIESSLDWFIAYLVGDDYIHIVEIFGKIPLAKVESICILNNKSFVRGEVVGHVKGFEKKYNTKIKMAIVERRVK